MSQESRPLIDISRDKSALYIHIPFCRHKCAYCDFYSSAGGSRSSEIFGAYVSAVLNEWHLRSAELPTLPRTIYLGGGTPSLLPIETLSTLIAGLLNDIPRNRLVEVTIEANPEDVTSEWLSRMRSMGINRVSIGIQSFHKDELQAVSRRHSPDDAVRALSTLADGGWNYSADLIYGLPGQSVESWCYNLHRLLAFRPPHFSAYLLSYEPGTPLYIRLNKGTVKEADDSMVSEMYGLLCKAAAEAGYRHYEISNFALPGYEAVHNSSYWDLTPYLGLGAGAHSFDKDGIRRFNPNSYQRYIQSLSAGRLFCVIDEETSRSQINDFIITALRTFQGLDPKKIPIILRDEFSQNLEPLLNEGSVEINGKNIVIHEDLWLTSDAILRRLIL